MSNQALVEPSTHGIHIIDRDSKLLVDCSCKRRHLGAFQYDGSDIWMLFHQRLGHRHELHLNHWPIIRGALSYKLLQRTMSGWTGDMQAMMLLVRNAELSEVSMRELRAIERDDANVFLGR